VVGLNPSGISRRVPAFGFGCRLCFGHEPCRCQPNFLDRIVGIADPPHTLAMAATAASECDPPFFTETAEPEEVLDFLREYHGALGPLVSQFEGTLDQFSGDGIMVFFNDPVPCPDPAERAVNMAVAMREAAGTLITDWRERGRDLGFGAGIAQGYATLGQIGFSERSGYTAIGTVCNVAARLCAEAKDGQILLSQRVNVALKGSVATEQVGALALKGLTQPVVAYNVPLAPIQPGLRVIEGGPQSV
jgi:class 3 adenylate cyclase